MKKAYLNWSSGKDAAFALYKIQQEAELSITKLVTTVNSESNSVSMHNLDVQLLKQQAEHLGIELHLIKLPAGDVSMVDYNKIMKDAVTSLKNEGFRISVFGDIFLEDLKRYREEKLQEIGMKAVFPLWKLDTKELLLDFIAKGFKAITICVNAKVLSKDFCGRIIDKDFVDSLPDGVDPCGENGEFHTFVFDGPIFSTPVSYIKGEVYKKIYSEGNENNTWDSKFYYCDLQSGMK